ncbi:hypothetical protein BC833DRAFT_607486 [Globomyces pollinis-pini]|nr:hypothetical protein BC833DRAFT_607486 [Globomyces pollinis-pini]
MATIEKALPKRDLLLGLELKAQARWELEKLHEANAPNENDLKNEKYMVTFPYPYMNGRMHLGHTFSVSKAEFATRYQRLKGKTCLFPFGFHCTGMPIKTAADKLKKEIEMFGPLFENYKESEEVVETTTVEASDPSKKKKHGKAAVKAGGGNYQFQIMRSIGVPNEEIQVFADPKHWIYYFPPITTADVKRLGLHVDWRRSFITTDANPYYDSFVQWQFNQLRILQKVKFGERYTIYSAVDGQACMDHDRSAGEGVGVQEYTGIKMKVLLDDLNADEVSSRPLLKDDIPVGNVISSDKFKKVLGDRQLYLVAATLRPETMYGQTNCYVGVDLDYGVFEVNDKEAWVCTERAAKNMAFQGIFNKEKGEIVKLIDLKGWDLVGLPLSAPLCQYKKVYTLPMEGVLANKGTGVVTSVPSDSPDDYVTLMDLQKKAAYYKVQEAWVTPFLPPLPIISTPNLGDTAAVTAVQKLKINSQKDKKQLADAKDMVYKEGFYHGKMIVGEYSGKSVQEAKPLIRDMLIKQGLAFAYAEPEGLVISRSGDECVVALAAQWYLDYGEDAWKADAIDCVKQMNTYGPEIENAMLKTLDWLNQWACARSFGLGTKLPWDKEWLIESLSDSTIYMAYYTVAHILHEGTLDGSKPSKYGIKPSDMTDEVWSHIFTNSPIKNSKIPADTLKLMKREFEYFYPMDLRTSGKDLINNHLTFMIYNHVAIFAKKYWPRSVRANGLLLLNNEKMSKSTGNFLTMADAIKKYGADATRFALADAGDGLEDANFLEKTADDAILKLFTEREFIEEALKNENNLRHGDFSWNDKVFLTEIDKIINECEVQYENMLYREAIKVGYYDLQNARNEYRKATTGQGLTILGDSEVFEMMHIDVIKRFAEVQALLLAPITPHWSEHVWSELLKNKTSILHAKWPETKPTDMGLIAAAEYIRGLGNKIRSAEDAASKKKSKKGKAVPEVANDGPKTMNLFVASVFPDWQEKAIEVLKATYDPATGKLNGGERPLLKEAGLDKDKRVMPFLAMVKKNFESQGQAALDRKLLFSEIDTIQVNMDALRRDLAVLKITNIQVIKTDQVTDEEDAKKAETAVPGQPTYRTF